MGYSVPNYGIYRKMSLYRRHLSITNELFSATHYIEKYRYVKTLEHHEELFSAKHYIEKYRYVETKGTWTSEEPFRANNVFVK